MPGTTVQAKYPASQSASGVLCCLRPWRAGASVLRLDGTDGVDPVQDGVLQVIRGRLLAGTLDHVADDAFEVVLLRAFRAVIEMVLDFGNILAGQCPVEVLIDALHPGIVAVAQSLAVAHFLFSCVLLSAAPVDPVAALNPRSAA